ncbi:MAG: hypothetical protein ACI84R_001846 [Candidatus Azotimanducaceae bacterium]|jgi:hypothetical protein
MAESLIELQKWMHTALLDPQAVPEAGSTDRLVPNPRLSAQDALAIYQRSYSLRIAACMREQFPALCHALGDELFNDFVAEYVREAPPESYTLYDLGRRFTDYLEANRPDRDEELREGWIDFIVDLARFERSVFATFDCPGAEGMELAQRDTPDCQLKAQPSLSVGQYRFPVAKYYHQVREKMSPSPPDPITSYIAIVRKDYQTTTLQINLNQFVFLNAVCAGSSIERALEVVGTHASVTTDQAKATWARMDDVRMAWVDAGFFVVRER